MRSFNMLPMVILAALDPISRLSLCLPSYLTVFMQHSYEPWACQLFRRSTFLPELFMCHPCPVCGFKPSYYVLFINWIPWEANKTHRVLSSKFIHLRVSLVISMTGVSASESILCLTMSCRVNVFPTVCSKIFFYVRYTLGEKCRPNQTRVLAFRLSVHNTTAQLLRPPKIKIWWQQSH